MRALRRRLERASDRIQHYPISRTATREAFDVFKATGELPTAPRLAHSVTVYAQHSPAMRELLDRDAGWGELTALAVDQRDRTLDPVLCALYREAVVAIEPVSLLARVALNMLVRLGIDVTSPDSVDLSDQFHMPEFGPVGAAILEFPHRMLEQEGEEGAELVRRLDASRATIPENDRKWSRDLRRALERFHVDGEEPEDERLREAVLVLRSIDSVLQRRAVSDRPNTDRAKSETRGPRSAPRALPGTTGIEL